MALSPSSASGLLTHLCGLEGTGTLPTAMLVLAHPDDESIGAASLLPALGLATYAYVTDGAPREFERSMAPPGATRDDFADMRRGELVSALDSVGVPWERLEFADCVEREACLQLASLSLWLEIVMREHWPSIVLTHPYEGGHPDHDAAAFAVQAARGRIEATGDPAPVIAEFTSYHAQDSGRCFGRFLEEGREVVTRPLTAAERSLKRRLLGCYATQRDALGDVPLDAEHFRVAPAYDFTLPPHPGPLYYERFDWAPRSAVWCERARVALEQVRAATPTSFNTAAWRA